MANAKIETVKKKVEKEVPEKVYTLILNEEEARTLYALTSAVAGSSTNSYNRDIYSIWDELGAVGVSYTSFSSRFTIAYGSLSAKLLPVNQLPTF